MDSAQNTEQQQNLQQQKIDNIPLQKPQNQEEFKAAQASRRSRKDIQGRDFVCGCGKKYLSYPALYTHIKTKHEGKQPQGTMKYSTAAPPKKSKTKQQQQHLNYLISLVKRQDLKLIDLLAPKFVGQTPLSARLKSKILQKQTTDTYHALLKTQTSPLKLSKQTPLEQHLVAWLIGAGQFITQKLHDQYQWFARTVKQCYYQMGNEVYSKCFSKKEGGLCYVPNFKVQKVKYFPLICDFYIRFFLPYEYSQLNANLMELILTDFCNWLNRRKCTFIQIVLNKKYELTSPLKIQQQVKGDSRQEQNRNQQDEKCDISQLVDPQSQMRQIKELNMREQQNGKQINQQKRQLIQLENNNNQVQDNNQEEHIKDQKVQYKNQQNGLNGNIKEQSNHNNNHVEQENKVNGDKSINQLNHVNEEKNVYQNYQQEKRQNNQNQDNNQLVNNQIQIPQQSDQVTLNKQGQQHGNWSIQPEPAEQSSQSIPQQQNPVNNQNQQRFQSNIPQHQNNQTNNNQDVQSQRL